MCARFEEFELVMGKPSRFQVHYHIADTIFFNPDANSVLRVVDEHQTSKCAVVCGFESLGLKCALGRKCDSEENLRRLSLAATAAAVLFVAAATPSLDMESIPAVAGRSFPCIS